LGPDHPHVAADVAALAALIDGQERFEEAEALYQRALAIFKATLDPDHPHVLLCEENYAGLLEEIGQQVVPTPGVKL